MAINTPISENTSIGPHFQALYVTSMLYLGASCSSFFKGANISKFVEKFEHICNNYQMSIAKKICRLSWYCKVLTSWYVRSVIGFSKLNQIKTYTNLKKKYKDRDITHQIFSRAYLKAFKDKLKIKNVKVVQFYHNYLEISKELLCRKKLDKYIQLRQFF